MTTPELSLSVQYADRRLAERLPRYRIRRWVQAALQSPARLTIRFVDAEEGRALNRDYRNKDYATNVLTFAYDFDEKTVQADIILCTDVLLAEAEEQHKSLEAHAAHLVVHGTLHAQGYEHEADDEAEKMEALEAAILARFSIANPYLTS